MSKDAKSFENQIIPTFNAQDEDSDDFFDNVENEQKLVSPLLAAARVVVDAYLGKLVEQLVAGEPVCAVIIPQSADWCQPVSDALLEAAREKRLFLPNGIAMTMVRIEATSRQSARDEDSRRVVARLADGQALVGISHAPGQCLPATLLRASDLSITLPPLSGAFLRQIVETVTGEDPGEISGKLAGGMALVDIATSVRPGSTATACLVRLERAIAARSQTRSISAPPLEELAGYGEAKAWGLALARDIARYRSGDGSVRLEDISPGLLLSGPPGCGKTLYAQALARSCGMPIVATSAAKWLSNGSGHLDDAIKGMRADFDAAHGMRPCILFIDEVDAIVDPSEDSTSKSWWMSFRAGLLSIIDGATSEPGIILVGACNHPKLVDAALRRSGRLDRHIAIPLPDRDALEQIMRSHLGDDLPGADLQGLAQAAIGCSGADVARYVREARARARDAGREIEIEDLRRTVCPMDSRSTDLLHSIALHEAGHAVVATLLGRPVGHVSVVASAEAAGHVAISSPERLSRSAIDETVLIALAGRASDVVLGNGACAGATSDLELATRLVANARHLQGLGGSLLSLGSSQNVSQLLLMDRALRESVELELLRFWHRAMALVQANSGVIRLVAEALARERVLSAERLDEVMAEAKRECAQGAPC